MKPRNPVVKDSRSDDRWEEYTPTEEEYAKYPNMRMFHSWLKKKGLKPKRWRRSK